MSEKIIEPILTPRAGFMWYLDYTVRFPFYKLMDSFYYAIACHYIPRRLAYWITVRVISHAISGAYTNVDVLAVLEKWNNE